MTAPEKATEFEHGLLQAWTMANGHLTRITQLLEGFQITTIVADPVGLTCALSASFEPDTKTRKIEVYSRVDGLPSEIYSSSMDSSTCIITKGNIFATDK